MKTTTYAGVFGALALITAIEVQVANAPVARATMASAIVALAGLKGLLIAMYYMHLRYERRSAVAAVAIPPLIAVVILLAAMSVS